MNQFTQKPIVVSIIPARGGSKGIPRKNIRQVGGKPLIAWTIEESLASPSVTKTVVTTDDSKIASVAAKYGAEVIMRPAELAGDTTPTEPAIIHALGELKREGFVPDYELLLQPTCPTRTSLHIEEAINIIREGEYDSVIGVVPVYKYRYDLHESNRLTKCFSKRARRQEREPQYLENGTIYLTRRELAEKGDLFGENIGAVIMDHAASINIDDEVDLAVAEETIKSLQYKKIHA